MIRIKHFELRKTIDDILQIYDYDTVVNRTDRAQFCGTSRDPREGLWMIQFLKICFLQNSVFENFENPRNFLEIPRNFVCFYFTIYIKRTCSQLK